MKSLIVAVVLVVMCGCGDNAGQPLTGIISGAYTAINVPKGYNVGALVAEQLKESGKVYCWEPCFGCRDRCRRRFVEKWELRGDPDSGQATVIFYHSYQDRGDEFDNPEMFCFERHAHELWKEHRRKIGIMEP